MTNSKSTKRALLTSVLALLMCVAMLIGTTFAWFTDTASTGVNKIQAGNLNIELQMKDNNGKWVNAEGKTLPFLVEGKIPAEGTQILWEPGCTYYVPQIRVLNKGNLAVKFEYLPEALGLTGKLAEVLTFTAKTFDKEGNEDPDINIEPEVLEPGEASPAWSFGYHMDENAGNEYQKATATGMCVTVVATQVPYEKDSISDQYDKDATYPVTTTDELIAALQSKEAIVLGNDITITTTISTADNLKQTLDFNGHKLILDGADEFDYGCLDVNGELTLADSVGGGGIKGKFYDGFDKVPTAVFINDGAVVNLESGTIENVYRGVANYYSGGTFNMTGGKIAVKQASAIESAGVLFHRGGTVNLNGGEISGAIYFEKTATSQPSYTIGAGFTNTNNSVFNTSGVTATQNEDGIWISTIM